MSLDIQLISAGRNGQVIHLNGDQAGAEGITLGAGQVEGIYDAPTATHWHRARRQRGARYAGKEQMERDLVLGFHVIGNAGEWLRRDSLLRQAFTYHLDEWDEDDKLAQLLVRVDGEERRLSVQMAKEPEFAPDLDPDQLQYGNVFYRLKVAQPMWEGTEEFSAVEFTAPGTKAIEVANPTDQPMFHYWALTPGEYILPDPFWGGPARSRIIRESRNIPLRPITANHEGVVIHLDPMRRMFSSVSGENITGQVGGGYWFINEIPPYTQPTELPVTAVSVPSEGGRVELHQPRLWSRPWGLR